MRKVSVPVERPVTAAVIGLPAAELAKTLDGILDGDASPENDTPTAFPQGDDPYSLEELLSGLEPVDADDVAPIDDGLEPALLLSETELPDAIATDGWLGEPALAPEELPAEPEDTAPVLELPSDEVLLLTSDMVLEAAARQDEDLGEADPDDHTTAALSAIAAALHALDGPPPPPESAAAEGDSAGDDDLDAPLLLTDAYLAPEPALAEIPAEAAAEEAAPEEDVYELTEIVAEPAALEAAPEEDVYELTEIVTEPAAVEAAPEEDVFEPTEIVAQPAALEAAPEEDVYELTEIVTEPAAVEAAPEEDVYELTEIVTQPAAVEAAPEEDVYELTEIVAEPAVVEAALDEDVYELTEIVAEPAAVEAALDEDVYELTEIVTEPAVVEAALDEDVYELTEIVAEPAAVEAALEEDVYEPTEIVAEPAVVEAEAEKDGYEPTEIVAEPAVVEAALDEDVYELTEIVTEPAAVEAAAEEDVFEPTEIVAEPAAVEAEAEEDVYELTEIVAQPAAVEAEAEEDVYEPTEIVAEPAVVEAEAEEDVYELAEIVAQPAAVEAAPEKDGFEPTEVVAEPAAVGPAPEEGEVEVGDVTAEEPVTASVEAGEEPVPGSRLSLADRVEAIIAAYGGAEGHGDATLPASEDALALLLSEPPPMDDFAALDALYACWPRSTQDCPSRALLAVAHNLTRNFGLPGRLPMASAKAWRMLSPKVFEAELAQRLTDTGTFIADWQKTQNHFLILEFGEIELIEYLFEALPPAAHADLLVGVMNFKVLSNRRMGLLRRVPGRVKKQVLPLLPARKDEALLILAHTKALLERVAEPNGFAPIVATAVKAAEEVDKMMRAVAAIGLPPPSPPEGGGQALGRIG